MSQWIVDIAARKIEHESGFLIVFEGEPETDYFNGNPQNYPANLTPLQLSRLIREGFEEFRLAWKKARDKTAMLLESR